MVAVPLPFLVEGRQKKLATLNRIQHAAAVIDPGYGSTEQNREPLENGGSQHELNQVGRKEGRKVRQIAFMVTGLYTGLHGDYTDHRSEGADR